MTRQGRIFTFGALAILAFAVALTYGTSLRAPFLFDDVPAIVDNTSIRNVRDLRTVLSPPSDAGNTVGGRPLLNLTFALNHAAGGIDPAGYRAVNIGIHLAGAFVLFGIVRRTLRTAPLRERFDQAADAIALFAALAWMLHPLQTESVTYVAQRAESLMGLCYLLTLYAFIRAATADRPEHLHAGWTVAAVAACLCGVATKEVMVTAPIVALLYDRVFLSRSLRAAWRRHGILHALLFTTWALLALLVLHNADRGGSIGPVSGVAWWQYALTQARGVWLYLRLVAWPHPLIVDYGHDFVSFATAAPCLVAVLALAAAAAFGLARGNPAMFAIACFLGILVPSSSVVGGSRQMLAEHRLYLSLAPIVVLLGCAAYRAVGRRVFVAGAAVILALAALTAARNHDYRTERAIWTDTVLKRPQNESAHDGLGVALVHLGDTARARAEFETAIALNPSYADAHNNLGNLLFNSGDAAGAMAEYRTALRLKPQMPEAHADLGFVLVRTGHVEDGIAELETALRLRPAYVDAENNLAIAFLHAGKTREALEHARNATQLAPGSAAAHNTLGAALARTGELAAAEREFASAVRLDPRNPDAARNLAEARRRLGERTPDKHP